jgi:hypothetical protein
MERERDTLKQENATLKRQVEVLATRIDQMSSDEADVCRHCDINGCNGLPDECRTSMLKWSLEQAKKGGA